MRANSHNNLQMLSLSAKLAWAEVWHLWTVIIPRRSITGQLVFGRVWPRHDGHSGSTFEDCYGCSFLGRSVFRSRSGVVLAVHVCRVLKFTNLLA